MEVTVSRVETTHKSIRQQSCREVELATITITAGAANTVLEHGPCSQLYVNRSPCPLPQSCGAEVPPFYRGEKERHRGQQCFALLKKKKKKE